MSDQAVARTRSRPRYDEVLDACGLLSALATFSPRVVGTPPLGIDVSSSDIDIVCALDDAENFVEVVRRALGGYEQFAIHQWQCRKPTVVVARLHSHGWPIEIFGQNLPIEQQDGYRHFSVERRLLQFGGPSFRRAVVELKQRGHKTEPAFAQLLGLEGNPYQRILDLYLATDQELSMLVKKAPSIP